MPTNDVMAAAIRPARAADLADALALLVAAGLPTAGVAEHFPARSLVVRDPASGVLVAVAGVELHGAYGLLRSVAVSSDARGRGLGREIGAAAIDLARREGLRELFLLTTTADGFFPRFGFERISREELPAELGASEELRGACPASAVVMRLRF